MTLGPLTGRAALEHVKHGHVFIVCAGLLLFWIPLLSAKGGPRHRRAGRLYAAFMCVAGLSGAFLAFQYLFKDDKVYDGIFLLYAVVVFFSLGWHGMRALAAKAGPGLLRTPFNLGLDAFDMLAGVLLTLVGLRRHDWYLFGIGPIGALVGARHMRLILSGGAGPDWWLKEHLAGMIATGIAGYTALIFFELSKYLPRSLPSSGLLLIWLSPLIAGTAAILRFRRRGRNCIMEKS